MKPQLVPLTLAILAMLTCAGCSTSRGRPGPDSEVVPPGDVVEFRALFEENCAGCHGHGGKGQAAIALADPVFLAIADDATIRRATANGVPGTPMPAFAQSAGGMLMDKQVDAIVSGIRSWAKPDILRNAAPPPYTPETAGDPQRGNEVFATYCSSCHGANGRGGQKASSIVDGAYLALVSDQDLRNVVIVGRPELGAPDWRGNVSGRPMSPQDVSDVVAWLAAQRPRFPGQPYPNPSAKLTTKGLP